MVRCRALFNMSKKPYQLRYTDADDKAAIFLGGRYFWADAFTDLVHECDDARFVDVADDGMVFELELEEHQAWTFIEAVNEDDGFLPCLREGTLWRSIVDLMGRVV